MHGFESQGLRAGYENAGQFKSWLQGKINYVKHIHPNHGLKLQELFENAIRMHNPEWIEVTNEPVN
jgi:5-methylcytosine-specific restriction endonuclease McrBC regulatory subunit McrC